MTIVTMPPLTAPSNLPTLIKDAFVKAQASGDLIYYPTQVAILPVGSLAVRTDMSDGVGTAQRGLTAR